MDDNEVPECSSRKAILDKSQGKRNRHADQHQANDKAEQQATSIGSALLFLGRRDLILHLMGGNQHVLLAGRYAPGRLQQSKQE